MHRLWVDDGKARVYISPAPCFGSQEDDLFPPSMNDAQNKQRVLIAKIFRKFDMLLIVLIHVCWLNPVVSPFQSIPSQLEQVKSDYFPLKSS